MIYSKPPVRLPFEVVAHYLDQLADALDEAHAQGLIHRDIKPLNILLDRRGRLLIADFGLATALSHSQSSVLVEANTSGTPPYMAPEQWLGQAGKASDIYALGVMVYQMVTGQLPYQGGQFELMGQHLNAPVPTLSYRASDLQYPDEWDEIIAGVMAKDPKERTRPATEFYRRFEAALKGGSNPVEVKGEAVLGDVPLKRLPEILTQPQPKQLPLPGSEIQQAAQPLRGSQTRVASLPPQPLAGTVLASQPASNSSSQTRQNQAGQARTELAATQMAATQMAATQMAKSPFPPPGKTLLPEPITVAPPFPPNQKSKTLLWVGIGGAILVLFFFAGLVVISSAAKPPFLPTSISNFATSTVASTISASAPTTGSLSSNGSSTFTPVPGATFVAAPTPKYTLTGHNGWVSEVAFSPNGKILASSSIDHNVMLWDLTSDPPKSRNLTRDTSEIWSIAFSPDGKTLAVGSENIRLWDVASGQPIGPSLNSNTVVYSLAFSPDGKTLAIGGQDKKIQLWDVASGQPKGPPLTGHTDWVRIVAFSPDGKTLVQHNSKKVSN